MIDPGKIAEWANSLGVITIFVLLGYALHKRHLVLGYQLVERDKRIANLEAENRELLRHIFRSVGVFSKAMGREIPDLPTPSSVGILPDQEEG
jgi:hypothetical protein